MSESAGEKTEQPTEQKLQNIRKKGSVPQSQDLNKLFVTLAGIELFISQHQQLLTDLKALFAKTFQAQRLDDYGAAMKSIASESFDLWLNFTVILLLVVLVARLGAGFSQFGFLMAPEALTPNMGKFNPVSNFKQFFKKKKLVELISNIFKAVFISIILIYVIKGALPFLMLLPNTGLEPSVNYSIELFSKMAHYCLVFFLILSFIDFKLQKGMFMKEQMMTKDEVFREFKQSEGDPMLKGERQALAQEMAMGGGAPPAKQAVKESDAVVVNPTHFAIAIEYKPGKTPLPVIRAKGLDDKAKDMIEYAKDANLPVVRHVTLARYLFRAGKENKYIPRPALQDMALVLRTILEAKANGETLDHLHDLTEK